MNTEVAQPTPNEKNPISAKLESCIEKMNIIHNKVDNMREKVLGEGRGEELESTTPNSIEGMADTLISMIIDLREKVDIINERL